MHSGTVNSLWQINPCFVKQYGYDCAKMAFMIKYLCKGVKMECALCLNGKVVKINENCDRSPL